MDWVPGCLQRAGAGYIVTHNGETLTSTGEQLNQTFCYCMEGICGEYRVSSLGTGECGVFSVVSLADRNRIYAKRLQGASHLQQPEHGVLVASLMVVSKGRNIFPTGGGGVCPSSLFPEEPELCKVFC